jgi:choline monooxygenase
MQAQITPGAETEALGESLSAGATLPASWYTSNAVFCLEKRAIFSRYWQYACRADEVARPGDYLACRAGSVPVVVVRNLDNELTAFVNVCKHRGAEIVLEGGRGNRNTLQCHYHAWTWNLDGTLRTAPGSEVEACFRSEDYPLTAVEVAVLGQFIFVKPDPQAPGWDETVGALAEIVAASPLATLRLRERRTYDMKANWKIVVENFLECYHCAIAHKGFANLIDLKAYTVIPHRYFSTQRGPLKTSSSARKDTACFSREGGGQEGIYNYLWPNFMVNLYPGRSNASTNIILPVAPDRTLAIYDFYFEEGMPESEAATMVAFIDQVQQEDIIICESVQRGLSSGFCEQGRLMIHHEKGIQHFDRLVFEALTRSDPHRSPR